MEITKVDRERARTGANTPVWQSADGAKTAFLTRNMKIVIRTQYEFENPVFSEPMSQRKAREILDNYDPDM